MPEGDFWEAYSRLWETSQHPSAFQAPHFIRYLAGLESDSLLLYTCYRDEELIGATFFSRHGKEFRFLSDLKTDHNFFLFSKEASVEEMEFFFRELATAIKAGNWTFRLNNLPSWAPYHDAFTKALERSGLFFREVRYNACMVLAEKTPEAGFKACNRQKLRQKMHRLEDRGMLVLEAYREEEDLENWMNDFCNMHIVRWPDTSTPSNLLTKGKCEFVTGCVKSWIKDGILVRFSLKLDDARLAFIIALLEGATLVHHSTTFDIDHVKQSPGLIIIRSVAQWMQERGLRKMEFGDGGEEYKLNFTKVGLPMHRLFISGPRNLPFMMKTQLINSVRRNEALHKYYFDRVRPMLLKSSLTRGRVT